MAEKQLQRRSELLQGHDRDRSVQVQGLAGANDHLTVVKNPHYWRKDSFGQQLPYLDSITFKPGPGP